MLTFFKCKVLPGLGGAVLLFICALVAGTCRADGFPADPIFDLKKLTDPPLDATLLSRSETNGIAIEEVRFFSEQDGTNRVEIFAIMAYPKEAKALPAVIWNQGGMAQATPYFPLLLARRGYVGMCIDFPQAGYRSTGGYHINSGLELTEKPERAPIAHAATALVRAVSYLQTRPEADPERIGMCGSSWGGFFTTLAAGIDPRIKAASAMFGCGMLQNGCAWFHGNGNPPPQAYLDRWANTLDPACRLKNMTRPIAWFSGCNDHFYWLGPLLATYARPTGAKHLALLPNSDHGLNPEMDEQVFAWLDVHLKGAPPFIAVENPRVELKAGRRMFCWDWKSPARQPVAAELALSIGRPGNWKTRYWQVTPAALGKGVCEAPLPSLGIPALAFGTVVETNGYRSSTTAIEIPAAPAGAALDPLEYNGCSMWGDFEPEELVHLRAFAMAQPWPATTNQARSGTQAVVVHNALTISSGLYYTAGLPHVFSLFARSDQPATLAATLHGRFDGQPRAWSNEIATGPDWAELIIPFTPPDCVAPNLSVKFEARGGPETLDAVTLKPAQ